MADASLPDRVEAARRAAIEAVSSAIYDLAQNHVSVLGVNVGVVANGIMRLTLIDALGIAIPAALAAADACEAERNPTCNDPSHAEPFACYRQVEGGWVCESTLKLEALKKERHPNTTDERPPMLFVDARCTMRQCADIKDVYRMVGRCENCAAEPVLVMFTSGHESDKVRCPKCGNNAVSVTRLATDDEIPTAVSSKDVHRERERDET